VLLGKSVGILFSMPSKQLTKTPSGMSVQLQTLGQDDATPTSKLTATITVIRNFILRRQSTSTKCIYLIVIVPCCYAFITEIK